MRMKEDVLEVAEIVVVKKAGAEDAKKVPWLDRLWACLI